MTIFRLVANETENKSENYNTNNCFLISHKENIRDMAGLKIYEWY